MTEEDNNNQDDPTRAEAQRVVGNLNEDDLRWLEESTAASGVPLHVEDASVIGELANALTLSKRS